MSQLKTILPRAYAVWASLAILSALLLGGASPENVTRVFVLVFLGLQYAFRRRLISEALSLSARTRFVLFGMALAAVVEGMHMTSTPVFGDVRVDAQSSLSQALWSYAIDLAYTLPAYLVIFTVIWKFLTRYQYTFWQYVLTMGLGQALGDGGIYFFIAAPPMIVFLPYVMSNYHAVNIIPFLSVRGELLAQRRDSPRKFLACPALVATYFCCGALIQIVGRLFGFK